MGHTLKRLAEKKLDNKCIFSDRFVVEVAEAIHVHYRNLRLILSVSDFKEISKGFVQALKRWQNRGCPEPENGQHIELCRKKVATDAHNEGIKINYNLNLYNLNKDKIFSEGAEFTDENYIHLKIRDQRVELSIDDFNLLAEAVAEAKENLDEIE